MSDYTSIATK